MRSTTKRFRPTLAKMVATGAAEVPQMGPAADSAAIVLRLSDIDADPKRNVRSHFDAKGEQSSDIHATADLAASILLRGQEQPVKVGPPNKEGKYPLIFGFRRYAAIKKIARETKNPDFPVRATLATGIDAAAADMSNLVENLVRQDLTPAQMAYGFARQVTAHGWTIKRLCEEVGRDETGAVIRGMSESNVGNLVRAYRKLTPTCLEAWYDGKLTVEGAFAICKYKPEEQNALLPLVKGRDGADLAGAIADYFLKRDGGAARATAGESAGGEGGTDGGSVDNVERPGHRAIAKAAEWAATKEAGLSPSVSETVVAVCTWLLNGGVLKVGGKRFDVEKYTAQVKAKAKAEKAKAKAEAKAKADAEKAEKAKAEAEAKAKAEKAKADKAKN